MKRIALDAMGGDLGPGVVVLAAAQSLAEHPDIHLSLVGQPEALEHLMAAQHLNSHERCSLVPASEVVKMDESPASAVRNKRDSSMRVAIDLVKAGQVHACVSAGNTGALMATAHFVLKTLPGVSRSAIVASFPTQNFDRQVRIMDLGANVESSAEQLYQFAVMGSILAQALDPEGRKPKLGLLNIGHEAIKGVDVVKEAAERIEANKAINYIGFVEGNQIFTGRADVVICDGFVGNITLKACEGLAKMFGSYTKELFKANWLTKCAGLIARPVLKKLAMQLDPRDRNGATLLGLNGIVVKSHGGAGVKAYMSAIDEAVLEVSKNVPELIRHQVAEALTEGEPVQ